MVKALAVIISVLIFTTAVFAGPYCALTPYGKKCDFYDYTSCQKAAGPGGSCQSNTDGDTQVKAKPKYCSVTMYGTDCSFLDEFSCRQAAAKKNGTCKLSAY